MRKWFAGIFKDGIPCSRYLPTFEVSLIYFESSDGFWQCCRQLCRQHIVLLRSIVSCLANRWCKREILQGQEWILWVLPKLPEPLTILFPSIITFWLLPLRDSLPRILSSFFWHRENSLPSRLTGDVLCKFQQELIVIDFVESQYTDFYFLA